MEKIIKNGVRYYVDNSDSYISVTSLLNVLNPFDKESWLNTLSNKNPHLSRQKVNDLADEISKYSTTRGQSIHNQIENYFLNNADLDLEKASMASLIKEYILPEEIEGKKQVEVQVKYDLNQMRYAGTFDLCCFFQKPFQEYKTGNPIHVGKSILDWKNTRKIKYSKSYSPRKKQSYYPLTKYFLQLSAYVAGYNSLVEEENKINETVVVINPEKTKLTYVYYCDAPKTMFYWGIFKELYQSYLEGKPFNWDYLDYEITLNNAEPQRLLPCLTS